MTISSFCSNVTEILEHVSNNDDVKIDVKSKDGIWSLLKLTLIKSKKPAITNDLIKLDEAIETVKDEVFVEAIENVIVEATNGDDLRKETTDLLTNLEKLSASVPTNVLEANVPLASPEKPPMSPPRSQWLILPLSCA